MANFQHFCSPLECKLVSCRPYCLQQHIPKEMLWRQSEENGECLQSLVAQLLEHVLTLFTLYIHLCCVSSLFMWGFCDVCFIQITVQKPVKEGQEEIIDVDLEQTSCEVCGGSDREDRLLLCDGCDSG